LPLANYPLGAIFECTMTSYNNANNCESKIQVVLVKPITINPNFSASFPCNHSTFSPIPFINETSFVNGTVDEWNWDFGDGTNSKEQNPNHVFSNSGTYTITLTATPM
jgi:PKD repeat protein